MIIKTIYDLKLHETIVIEKGNTEVMRVAGGWNYIYYRIEEIGYRNYKKEILGICFVPYDNEFIERTSNVSKPDWAK